MGRVGGDEFVVLLQSAHLDGLQSKIMDRLSKTLGLFNRQIEKPYELSLTVGVAKCNKKKKNTLEKLMREADLDLIGNKRRRKMNSLIP